jgi:glycosyltransferase involved in cell wall biosynthesis
MRIAWIVYGSLEQRTGGTIYDAEVVSALRAAGDEVHVVSLDGSDPAARRGFAVTLPPLSRAATTASAGITLARRVEAIAPDVVVGDELCFAELAIAFRWLGRRRGAPRRVLLVHHLTAWEPELALLRRRVVRLGERLAIEASDALVTTSRTTRERLLAEGVRGRIDVALPGADRLARVREGRPARTRGDDVRFVFVGAITPRKRVLEMVRAFARGASAHGRLVLVGSSTRDPTYVAEVRRAVVELALGDRVAMTGEIGEDGVARALDAADVLVMPSSLEGYGIAATEAIHAGIPVIAARAQGLEEALAPCPDARLFADDEASLAGAMQRFATDPAQRGAMRSAARDASSRMPTWATCGARFRDALRR